MLINPDTAYLCGLFSALCLVCKCAEWMEIERETWQCQCQGHGQVKVSGVTTTTAMCGKQKILFGFG